MNFKLSAKKILDREGRNPQASTIIPADWWPDFEILDETSKNSLLELMTSGAEVLNKSILTIQLPPKLRPRAFLIIAVATDLKLPFRALFKIRTILDISDKDLFELACQWGDIDFLSEFSNDLEPKALQSFIASNHYAAFQNAAANGHLDVLELLSKKVSSKKLRAMIAKDHYAAFQNAAASGHLGVLEFLGKKVSTKEELKAMIAAADYYAFQNAAANGDLGVLEFLAKKVSTKELKAMIAKDHYVAFQNAAANGHLGVLEFLVRNASPKELKDMIAADGYRAFRKAAYGGHLEALEFLVRNASPEELKAMIAAHDQQGPYAAFQDAAQKGHLDVLKFLVKKASPEELEAMIAARGYASFQHVVENFNRYANNYFDVWMYLLQFEAILKQVEMNPQYQLYIQKFHSHTAKTQISQKANTSTMGVFGVRQGPSEKQTSLDHDAADKQSPGHDDDSAHAQGPKH